MSDELGQQIFNSCCAECWQEWLGQGIKVINEMRLDLSTERGRHCADVAASVLDPRLRRVRA